MVYKELFIMKKQKLSACCGAKKTLSISTRKGRRIICNNCGIDFVPEDIRCSVKNGILTCFCGTVACKNSPKEVITTKTGYAIIDERFNIQYTDFDFTEEEMRNWYRNQLENGYELAKITLEKL